MSHDLLIVRDVFLSLFGLGFICWLFWYALKKSDNPPQLIFKWLITIPLIIVYWKIIMPWVKGGGYGAIGGIVLSVVWGNVMYMIWRHSVIDLIANP